MCTHMSSYLVLNQSLELLLRVVMLPFVTVLRMGFYNLHPAYDKLVRLLESRTVFSLTVFRSRLSDGNPLPQVFGPRVLFEK